MMRRNGWVIVLALVAVLGAFVVFFLDGAERKGAARGPQALETQRSAKNELADPLAESGSIATRAALPSEDETEGVPGSEAPSVVPNAQLAGNEQPLGGLEVWFLVGDHALTPLPGGSVTIGGNDGDSARGTPRESDGLIRIRGVPEGPVRIEASAPGFVTQRYDSLLPFDPPRIEGIALEPAATLTGEVRCKEGEPGSLTVFCWQERREIQKIVLELDDVDAGSFELDSVPEGTVLVTAVSRSLGQSNVVTASTKAGETTHVVLELGGGSSVSGVVLDQTTARPLPDAEVRLMVGTAAPVVEISSGFSDSEGRFLLEGATAAGSLVVVTAPGYSRQKREVVGAGRAIDLGTIALPKTQPLTICLVSDGALTTQGYTIASDDGRIPPSTFDSDGCLTIEDVSAEFLDCRIKAPDGTYLFILAHLDPGDDWRFEVPVQGYASAYVTFGEVQIEEQALLSLIYQPGPGVQLQRKVYVESTEPIVLDGLVPGEVNAYLSVGEVELGSDSATVQGREPIELHLGDEDAVRVRVIDGRGVPIEGASVICGTSGERGYSFEKQTDEAGLCSFSLERPVQLYAAVRHPERGFRPAVLVQSTDEPFDIVLSPTSSLELAFHSYAGSVAGLDCMLIDPLAGMVFELSKNTDSSGVIHWDRLHDGLYEVHVFHQGFFPLEAGMEVSGETRLERELRGRGNLTFSVADVEGLAVPGMPIHLHSVADDVSILAWVEREWIALPPQGLATDALGQMALQGLPSGPYEWTVGGSSGTVTLTANATVQQQVIVE